MREYVFGIVTAGVLLVAGCKRPGALPVAGSPDDPLALLRAPMADQLRARFSFKVDAARLGLKGSTGGALIVDRPGRLHFAVLGPLGGALATAQTDGARASVELRRQSQHIYADDLAETLQRWMGDDSGVDGLVGLLVGDVPLPAKLSDVRFDQDTATYALLRRGSGTVHVDLSGTPLYPTEVRVEDRSGTEQLRLHYDAPESYDAGVFPSGWALRVPSIDLQLDVRFKSFEALETVPDVFGTDAPDGFSSARWRDVLPAPR